MSRRVVLNCLAFARESGFLQGDLLVETLTRVHDSLSESTGRLQYRIAGKIGQRKRPQLLVEVEGDLSLRCQRCLEPLAYSLRLRNLLEFVDDDGDLTQEEVEDDSRDFLPLPEALDVATLVEDEVILALPAVPRHADCVLPGAMREEEATSQSPFSVLAAFKGRPQ